MAGRPRPTLPMLAAAACCLGILGVGDRYARADDFYAGKTVRLIVPSEAGSGGYGLYGRLAVEHLARHVPGRPTVIASYMPGGAGLTAMNYLYEVALRDGSVIGLLSQDLATDQVRGRAGVKYDAGRFSYIARATSNVPVHMVWHTAKVKSIADLKFHPVITAAIGGGGTHADFPLAQNALLGTKWKVVTGYRSANEVRAAMERGEVQAGVTPATLFNQQLKPWREQGLVEIVTQYADFRHPVFPNVPTIVEAADTPEAKAVFKFLTSLAVIGRSFAAPPTVPLRQMVILRRAFEAMLADPEFKQQSEKLGADIMPMSGDKLAAYVAEVLQTPPAILKRANEVIGGSR